MENIFDAKVIKLVYFILNTFFFIYLKEYYVCIEILILFIKINMNYLEF